MTRTQTLLVTGTLTTERVGIGKARYSFIRLREVGDGQREDRYLARACETA